ncbi:MAG TPA: GNAT family N-acetyltransferase, partial [Candidatus Baltobacteraceae bacterium]|nr:GNAT family N-acetyltransferase [Candidatus Baltobacteraceae bacterium]
MHELLNLVADLSAERFGPAARAAARERAAAAGFELQTRSCADGAYFAWIDETFGGSWSSEAFVSKNVAAIARNGGPAGFVSYDPQGLAFSWLRGAAWQPGTGVFGPFGVAPEVRGSALGPALLVEALAALREAGYARALIPAVGSAKLVRYYE